MDPDSRMAKRNLRFSIVTGLIILVILILTPIILTGGTGSAPVSSGNPAQAVRGVADFNPFTPVFPAPSDKINETTSPAFTRQLYDEARTYEPLLQARGTQVHMGFWSGRGNHGSLVILLDAINDRPSTPESFPQKAVWDEGATSSNQYPSYVAMLDEHWYERAASLNGTVTIYGKPYVDPHPVTLAQADDIWGHYSERYADMAIPIKEATGKPVNVWCFVEGARSNRIFYKYELPELRLLEQKGVVNVYFAKTRNATWTNPNDWIVGTANAPAPVPAS